MRYTCKSRTRVSLSDFACEPDAEGAAQTCASPIACCGARTRRSDDLAMSERQTPQLLTFEGSRSTILVAERGYSKGFATCRGRTK